MSSWSNTTWTYIAIGAAAGVSLIVWAWLVLVPGLDVVLARLGAARRRRCSASTCSRPSCSSASLLGGGFLWYFDEL